MEKNRRPILQNGEKYAKPIMKGVSGSKKEPKTSYQEAQSRILQGIAETKIRLSATPENKRLSSEFVVCIRMSPEFSAKSYYPDALFNALNKSRQSEEIGSRAWRRSDISTDEFSGKLFFVRTSSADIDNFEAKILKEEATVSKAFSYDIRKVDSFGILSDEEQVLGIPNDWTSGRLEAVLHPFKKDQDEALEKFFDIVRRCKVDLNKVRYKQYEAGVTFVSLYGNKDVIKELKGYNPLRMLHTLDARNLIDIKRGVTIKNGPLPAIGERTPVTIGVFDGGARVDNPYISKYCENIDLTVVPPVSDFQEHGTQVCGAALFGPLNKYSRSEVLPTPGVSVKSFRVFPTADANDIDLYEIIDSIEGVIPDHPEIKVYNLSFGPRGPILDDHISRFTFACDALSAKYNVLFVVAVGNDGDCFGDLARIQSPSDIANGLGVGAYTKADGKVVRAPYSCTGPGREGHKLKPDLLAFGGCDQYPIHLISDELNKKVSDAGTSFASPIVAGFAGQLIGYSDGAIDPLTARALLLHKANKVSDSMHDTEHGHGTLPDTIEDIISCDPRSYTLTYKGSLTSGKYAEFAIPWDPNIKEGKVNFRWSIAVTTEIDPLCPDEYTKSSVVLSFYPNANKYQFKKHGMGTRVIDIAVDENKANELLADGWIKSTFPISDSALAPYADESELRLQMKWDTVDTRSVRKMAASVSEPFFHIHALARGKKIEENKVRFVVVLTVEALDARVDLYSKIVARYRALAPIILDVENQINIKHEGAH
jgi:hypothetical protein